MFFNCVLSLFILCTYILWNDEKKFVSVLSSVDHILSNTEAVHSCMGYSVIVDFYLVPIYQMDPSVHCMFSAGATLF